MGISLRMLLKLIIIQSVVVFSYNAIASSTGCIKSEKDALLRFKHSLDDRVNTLSSWVGEDCCSWTGVSCSNITGHVLKLQLHNPNLLLGGLGGELSPALLDLSHLEYLDLSMNWFGFNIAIPSFLGSLKNLKYLNLANGGFAGSVPPHLGNLSKLEYLDLTNAAFRLDSLQWVSTLSSLKYLNLSSVNASSDINWVYAINMLPSLEELRLSSCDLSGIPVSLQANFSSLKVLDLSSNNLRSSLPNWIFNISSLEYLDLSFNSFQSSIPPQIGKQKFFRSLDLQSNLIEGNIPETLGNLHNLQQLYLNLNNLTGPIPESIGQLAKLEILDVSYNLLDGVISEHHFARLKYLRELYMHTNLLVFHVNPSWSAPFMLKWISLSSCKVGPQFPQWLKSQKNISFLEMSNTSISDSIPEWFENITSNIIELDLSHNQINKNLPRLKAGRNILLQNNMFEGPLIPFPSSVSTLDLSNNLLSGQIPQILCNKTPDLHFLSLSNNQLNGNISAFDCKMDNLQILDLSKNHLTGKIPECWDKIQHLKVLDLANNNLTGRIPVSLGFLQQLFSLHLQNNDLQGNIPSSIKKVNVVTLDLSENDFTGPIPQWIGVNLTELRVLNLQANRFSGEVPSQLCNLGYLSILNLGKNMLNGTIPHCFQNLNAMIGSERSNDLWDYYFNSGTPGGRPGIGYDENIKTYVKGMELQYTKTGKFLVSIDLSGNNFSGQIPTELMRLSGLNNLNLSGNKLEGRIPFQIGNLKILESLDLSRNELSGSIPSAISTLTYLSHLNLSFNNLSGRIPRGNQLQTLTDESIFMGNDGLCGLPLKRCPEDELPNVHPEKVEETKKEDSNRPWFYFGLATGFLAGFVGVCSVLYLKNSWRYAWFKLVDNICLKLAVMAAVKANQLRRKLNMENEI